MQLCHHDYHDVHCHLPRSYMGILKLAFVLPGKVSLRATQDLYIVTVKCKIYAHIGDAVGQGNRRQTRVTRKIITDYPKHRFTQVDAMHRLTVG